MAGARASEARLPQVAATRADLSGADLSNADLSQATFVEANLTGADLHRAMAFNAVMSRADLRSANLAGAVLVGVHFDGADLTGANLAGAELAGADFVGARGIEGAPLPLPPMTTADVRDAGSIRASAAPGDDVRRRGVGDYLSRRQLVAFIVAAALAGLWLLALLAVSIFRGDVHPPPNPPHTELGPESPALSNLLTSGFRLTPDSVPATVLDLAARRYVQIEQVAPGSFIVRLERADREEDDELQPYEQRVLQLLRSRASDGVVPTTALTTGPREESRMWWRAFEKDVITESKAKNLSENFWSPTLVSAFCAGAAIPAIPITIGLGSMIFDFPGLWVGYGVLILVVLGAMSSTRRQRDRPSGRRAASRWLGLREYLEGAETFPTLSPAAVAVWDRYLAYGAALGVAAGAIHAMPMGAEDDHRAWSSYGGRWHQTRIRYPHMWPPAWGSHPVVALLRGLLAAGIAAMVFFVVVKVTASGSAPDQAQRINIGRGAAAVVGVLVAAWAASVMIVAISDLFSPVTMTGLVLRSRRRGGRGENSQPRFYIAIDDGQNPTKVMAWRVKSEVFTRCRQGDVVTAKVTRSLGYVRDLRVVPFRGP